MNPFDPDWGDDGMGMLYYDDLSPIPTTKMVEQVAKEIEKVKPWLLKAKPVDREIAVLHDWNTLFNMPGSMSPTANQTTMVELLYKSHFNVDFVDQNKIKQGILKKYKLLVTAGMPALDDETLNTIEKFVINGGHVISTARFAERDKLWKKRTNNPPFIFWIKG